MGESNKENQKFSNSQKLKVPVYSYWVQLGVTALGKQEMCKEGRQLIIFKSQALCQINTESD